MLKPNHYIAKLGYTSKNYYIFDRKRIKNDSRFRPDSEGFVPAEFWSLDNTLSLTIYSYLSYFKENVATDWCPSKVESAEKWNKILDKMISGFSAKLKISECHTNKEIDELQAQFKEGFTLLYKYYDCLWY